MKSLIQQKDRQSSLKSLKEPKWKTAFLFFFTYWHIPAVQVNYWNICRFAGICRASEPPCREELYCRGWRADEEASRARSQHVWKSEPSKRSCVMVEGVSPRADALISPWQQSGDWTIKLVVIHGNTYYNRFKRKIRKICKPRLGDCSPAALIN